MLIALTFLPIVTVISKEASAETDTQSSWSTLATMPTARSEFSLATIGGKIYAIGGINENKEPLNTVEEYNPSINAWTTKMSMPTARSGCAAAVYNNKIYVIGGTVGGGFLGNNEVYDPQTNTWTTAASMPTARADLCANIVNDAIYLIGGKKYASANPFYVETDVNEVYYPANNSWSTKTNLPKAVQGYASAVVGDKIYLIGGAKQPVTLGSLTLVNNNQVYNAATDSWSAAAPLFTGSSYGSAAATTGYLAPLAIYYMGGLSGDNFRKTVEIFNLKNNTWSDVEPMPTPRGSFGLVVVNDVLYAIGGYDGANYLTTNEQYKPVGYGTVPPQIQIISPRNLTYREVTLDYEVNRGIDWLGYSLDGQTNVTITSSITFSGLSQGSHKVVLYANDSAGNMGASDPVYFAIDTMPPKITILSPSNQSYDANDIQLNFLVDEGTTAIEYSLDGQQNVQIIGNVTLVALSNGPHRISVYAADAMGNVDYQTVYFNIAPFPTLTVIAVLVIVIIVVAIIYIMFKLKPKNKRHPKHAKVANPHIPLKLNRFRWENFN